MINFSIRCLSGRWVKHSYGKLKGRFHKPSGISGADIRLPWHGHCFVYYTTVVWICKYKNMKKIFGCQGIFWFFFYIKNHAETLTKRMKHGIIMSPHAEGSFFVRPHGGHHAAVQVFRKVRPLPVSSGKVSAEGGTTKGFRNPRKMESPIGKYPKFYRRCRTHESENYSCLQRMQTAQL